MKHEVERRKVKRRFGALRQERLAGGSIRASSEHQNSLPFSSRISLLRHQHHRIVISPASCHGGPQTAIGSRHAAMMGLDQQLGRELHPKGYLRNGKHPTYPSAQYHHHMMISFTFTFFWYLLCQKPSGFDDLYGLLNHPQPQRSCRRRFVGFTADFVEVIGSS